MWIHARGMLAALGAALLLAACGGGGGGGDGGGGGGADAPAEEASNGLVIDPASLRTSYVGLGRYRDLPVSSPTLAVTATFTESAPTGDVFVYVVQGEQVVERVLRAYSSASGRRSHWVVYFNPDLAPGEYEGTLRVQVCGDAACSPGQPAWHVSVPYEVTVVAGLELSISVNGERADEDKIVQVRDGDILTMSSTVPLRWSVNWSRGAHASRVEKTPSNWRAIARSGGSSSLGLSRQFGINAVSDALGAGTTVIFELSE